MAIRTDLYEILGVTPAATEEEVSRAYHLQLRRHHPDTRSDAPNSETAEPAEAIRVLVEAYAVLRDPVRRTEYDRRRARTGSASWKIDRKVDQPEAELDLLRAVSRVRWQPTSRTTRPEIRRAPPLSLWW